MCRPVTSLGHQGGEEFFEGQIFKLCPIVSKYVQHIFPGRAKIFLGGASPPSYGPAHVSSSYTMFMTNNMLLWWTLDSVPLPLVIKEKVAKEALQWSFERKCNVMSITRTDKRIELKMQLLPVPLPRVGFGGLSPTNKTPSLLN